MPKRIGLIFDAMYHDENKYPVWALRREDERRDRLVATSQGIDIAVVIKGKGAEDTSPQP
jgi:hypothetical protein